MQNIPIFDSHFHIIDYQFPLIENKGYYPSEFTCDAYKKRVAHLNIMGGALVSASFQAFDQSYLVAALQKLGTNFVGVTQVPFSISDQAILQLHAQGVRAVRFNVFRQGKEMLSELEAFAKRIYELSKWHVELYIDNKELALIKAILLRLPAVSIDHFGLSGAHFSDLLSLVEKGVKVKASGFGRVDFNVLEAINQIVSINEDALLFGTDLPSTRVVRIFQDEDVSLIADHFPKKILEKIFYKNAVEFYGVHSKI